MNKYDRHIYEAAGLDADPLPERWPPIIGWGLCAIGGLLFWAYVIYLIVR